MSERATQWGRWQALAAALVLVLCAATGLGAGAYTRGVLGRSGSIGSLTPSVAASPSTGTQPSKAPTATVTTASSVPVESGFTLSIVITPAQVSPGQQLTVVVTAIDRLGVAPVRGLQCFLQAPPRRLPLLSQWPGPGVSNEQGQATWSLVAPQVAPGNYGVEVIAYGPNRYFFRADALVTVTASG
jgi:hypothetical protein